MPAAFCGVYGIKPSHGRVPYWPTPANGLISHVGPLTRTVTDAALMLQAIAGPDDRDMTSLESEPEDFAGRLDEGIGQLRIGYSPDLGYLKVDAEVATLVGTAVAAFEELGCHVDEIQPGWDNPIEMEHLHFSANFASRLEPLLEKWHDQMDPGLVALVKHGMQFSAAEYCRLDEKRLALYDKVRSLFERYDLSDDDVSYSSLATEFGLDASTVNNHLAAARRDFRRLVLEKLREITATDEEFRTEARSLLGVDPK